jgi:hypothetical protein
MEWIDVHAHCVHSAYREYCLRNEFASHGHPDGTPGIPVHRPDEGLPPHELEIDTYDRNGIYQLK